ncbi:hypothetical protein ACVKN3_001736 [Luteibacter sp. PvP120]
MVLALLLRPYSYASYIFGQCVNLIFGVVMVTGLLCAGTAWAVGRWRTRHECGDHAALHRVRERARRRTGR